MAHVPRVYIPARLAPGPVVLPAETARRLAAVLRAREGDPLLLFAGDGREWHATVTAAARDSLHAAITELARQAPPPVITLETWCAMVRPNRFDWMLEKCVEAGSDVIRPLATDHAARGESASPARRERWQRVVIEAAEQSGRLYLPSIEQPAAFATCLGRLGTTVLLADADGRSLDDLRPLLPIAGHVAVAIGPEGGWSDAERQRARAAGALMLRLGPHTLRTETAAVVATAMLSAALAR